MGMGYLPVPVILKAYQRILVMSAAAPPTNVMNSRRPIAIAPEAQGIHLSGLNWRTERARKGHKETIQETALYNPSTMNARDFVALIRMAVISFVF